MAKFKFIKDYTATYSNGSVNPQNRPTYTKSYKVGDVIDAVEWEEGYLTANVDGTLPNESCGGCVTISIPKDNLMALGGGKLPDEVPSKYNINYTNTAIFGAIGGGIGYLVAKKLIKTDKVLFPILIGAAAFAYYQIDMSKKNR